MSCACENRKAMQELERVRALARKAAEMLDEIHVLYRKADGTYNFVPYGEEYNGEFVEYIFY